MLHGLAKSESYKVCIGVENWAQISGNPIITLDHPAFIHTDIKDDLKLENYLA